MGRWFVAGLCAVGCAMVLWGASATTPAEAEAQTPRGGAPSELFESEEFIVTFARAGDTPESLAGRFLGDPATAWMIEEYNGAAGFSPGQEVIIPKRPWNLAGVDPSGYQLVPILVYHNIGSEARGRLVIAAKNFEEQMRYLKAQGYRVVSLREFYEFASLRRQLPRKTVVLTFDDGYKSFLQFAYPLLKELGFTGTLFVYTDYVGTGRNALGWGELRQLDGEGFQVEAHTKTHSDLRRRPGEADGDYARRMQAELEQPLALFQRNLGRSSHLLAYPYGGHDDEVVQKVKEHGYLAAFSVRRQGSPSFVHPLQINRSQIYSEMTLEEFVKNLDVFHQEELR